jgi:hypothetical protein
MAVDRTTSSSAVSVFAAAARHSCKYAAGTATGRTCSDPNMVSEKTAGACTITGDIISAFTKRFDMHLCFGLICSVPQRVL